MAMAQVIDNGSLSRSTVEVIYGSYYSVLRCNGNGVRVCMAGQPRCGGGVVNNPNVPTFERRMPTLPPCARCGQRHDPRFEVCKPKPHAHCAIDGPCVGCA